MRSALEGGGELVVGEHQPHVVVQQQPDRRRVAQRPGHRRVGQLAAEHVVADGGVALVAPGEGTNLGAHLGAASAADSRLLLFTAAATSGFCSALTTAGSADGSGEGLVGQCQPDLGVGEDVEAGVGRGHLPQVGHLRAIQVGHQRVIGEHQAQRRIRQQPQRVRVLDQRRERLALYELLRRGVGQDDVGRADLRGRGSAWPRRWWPRSRDRAAGSRVIPYIPRTMAAAAARPHRIFLAMTVPPVCGRTAWCRPRAWWRTLRITSAASVAGGSAPPSCPSHRDTGSSLSSSWSGLIRKLPAGRPAAAGPNTGAISRSSPAPPRPPRSRRRRARRSSRRTIASR